VEISLQFLPVLRLPEEGTNKSSVEVSLDKKGKRRQGKMARRKEGR
jgi:hypothetical protein